MTAQAVFTFCDKRRLGTDSTSQTDTEFVDETTYREVLKRANAAELRREEMRAVVDGLNDQIATKTKIMLKLQSDLESARTARDSLFTDNSSLSQQLRILEREHSIDQNELSSLRLSSKSLRKEVKSMSKELSALKSLINTQKDAIIELEEVKEEHVVAAKEARSELRILYKQYFQPKTLSKMSKEHTESRRRSISIPKSDKKTEDTKTAVRTKRRFGSADKGKRDITQTLGLDSDLFPPRAEKLPQIPALAAENTAIAVEATPPAASPSIPELNPISEDDIRRTLDSQKSLHSDWLKGDLSDSPSPPILSKSPQIQAVSRPNLENNDEDLTYSLASTHIARKDTSAAGLTQKHSVSSSATKKIESGTEGERGGESRRESEVRRDMEEMEKGNEATTQSQIQCDIRSSSPTPSPFQSHPLSNPKVSGYSTEGLKEWMSRGVMTDPVRFYQSTECSSVGVQFNCERPEMKYEEEDGSFQGPDGVRYYMWPLNPNQLYGLSGDVFYHTVMRVFSSMPRVPLPRTGEPHQPQYRLAQVSGTQIPVNLEISPHQARVPHDPKTCGKDCLHLKRKGGKGRKEEKLWPVAKQDIRY